MVHNNEPATRSNSAVLLAVIILLAGTILELVGHKVAAGSGEILRETGFVLIGTVLATYLYEYILRRQHDDYLLRLVERSLVRGAQESGLFRIHQRLRFDMLFSRLEPGDELLWLDTYCPDQPNYQAHLREAIQRGARVKMLAVQPDCVVARMRATEINTDHGYSEERFRNEARNNLEHIRDALEFVSEDARARVAVRLYDDLPCVPAYIHIHKGRPYAGFSSFFLRDPSFNRPHVEWRPAGKGVLYDLCEYFYAKWDAHEADQVDLSARPKIIIVSQTDRSEN